MTRCNQCANIIPEDEGIGILRKQSWMYFCDNLCRANAAYDACGNATAQAEMKKLVAALYILNDIKLDRIPSLKLYDAESVAYRREGLLGLYHTVELSEILADARAMLAQIGDFGDETPKWAQNAIDSAEDCASIIADQVTA